LFLSCPCPFPSPSSSRLPPFLLQLTFPLASLATARAWFGLELPRTQGLKDSQGSPYQPPARGAPPGATHRHMGTGAFSGASQEHFQEPPWDHPPDGMETRENRGENRGENGAPMAVHGAFLGSAFVFHLPCSLCNHAIFGFHSVFTLVFTTVFTSVFTAGFTPRFSRGLSRACMQFSPRFSPRFSSVCGTVFTCPGHMLIGVPTGQIV